MREFMLVDIVKKCKEKKHAIIVGAGLVGKQLYGVLKQQGCVVVEFWDNNSKEIKIDSVIVKIPYKMQDSHYMFIIAVRDLKSRNTLFNQLIELGINKENIVLYNDLSDSKFIEGLEESDYPEIINNLYFKVFEKEINFNNPSTYNEKINWEKLYLRDPIRTRLADKVEVRQWIREEIGERYLTKWYGVWDNAEEIDFDKLPPSFVLKANNGSGRNILVKDKSEINTSAVISQLNEWKKQNYAFTALELQYKDILPKIICEEYLEGLAETVYDYNIYCFGGEPKYIWCIKGSHRPNCQASFYDLNWNMQPFSYGYPKDEIVAPRPEKLDEMLELSRKLCKQFNHVRVDWYNMPDGRVLFGEMTFTTWAGLRKFCPEEYDMEFGKLIKGK
ncbi:MAG: glycosyltransferase [Lachnospiraceae bacterium]|nr:glycosyltransferase [Lachnospiraceae bacterium]